MHSDAIASAKPTSSLARAELAASVSAFSPPRSAALAHWTCDAHPDKGRPRREAFTCACRSLSEDSHDTLTGVWTRDLHPATAKTARRLARHSRSCEKYSDVPNPRTPRLRVYAKWSNVGARSRTLRQFVTALGASAAETLDGDLRRGFSRWIRDLFGDRALAAELATREDRYRLERSLDVVPDMVNAVRSRHDLSDEPDV